MASAGTNGFDKSRERASAAGKKGGATPKRTLDVKVQEFLADRARVMDGSGNPVQLKREEIILLALFKEAAAGNARAAKELLDRGYGKAKEHVNIQHSGEIVTKTELNVGGTIKKQ